MKLKTLNTPPVKTLNLNKERWMHFCKQECANQYFNLMDGLTPLRQFLELPTEHQNKLLSAGYEYDDPSMLQKQRNRAGL